MFSPFREAGQPEDLRAGVWIVSKDRDRKLDKFVVNKFPFRHVHSVRTSLPL